MKEEARHLADPEPPVRGPFDQSEERPQFLLGGHQCCKARAQQERRAPDGEARLAPRRIGDLHAATTSPELSRFSA
jgi:hypothetical protein